LAAAGPDLSAYRTGFSGVRAAIVHYWLVTWRGGEKVVESILKLFPDADVYTLFFDREACGPSLQRHRVYSSFLDRGLLRRHYQKLFPLYPAGIRSLKLRDRYDIVISSESGPAKGIEIGEKTPHLCYIHTPMRYCWGYTDIYLDAMPAWARGVAARQFAKLREWDRTTINKVDRYVANSRNVAERVRKYYGREAAVCHPPIALDLFEGEPVRSGEREYYLSFGAITPYKNIGLLVEAFNRTNRRLIIVGDGSERSRLEREAGPNVSFTGTLPFSQVVGYIRNAKALLFPGDEDFGMVPLEVMSQGVPVIALGRGGALETVVENLEDPAASSGLFFPEPEVGCLLEAIERFERLEGRFDPLWIKRHARRFGEDRFLEEFSGFVRELLFPDAEKQPTVVNRHTD